MRNRLIASLTVFSFLASPFAVSSSWAAKVRDETPPVAKNNSAAAETKTRWQISGPFGGTVRSLAQDAQKPERMLLGTADGQIYVTDDGAKTWSWKSNFNRSGYVLDNVLIDPKDSNAIYVGAWILKDDKRGAIFKSSDGGETWREVLKEESVRALAIAPLSSNVLVAGTLTGVFRSDDAGATWTKISPDDNTEIRNIESIAIDPRDSNVIYAGTWHLPWKTTDGGKTWFSVKGDLSKIIDDSDIFSVKVDNFNSDRVYCSACSGIYQSLDNGKNWTKFKGIPFSARRTHVIYQNPKREQEIYAGTTEGLWRTLDGGQTWAMMTPATTVINDIEIHPSAPDRVIIGTQNSGVLISEDNCRTFRPFNAGFVTRQVSAIIVDPIQRGRLFASALFNGAEGGVYVSNDNGRSWQPASNGLGARDVYSLHLSPTNPRQLFAATSQGVFVSENAGGLWKRAEIKAKGAKGRKGPAGAALAPTSGQPVALKTAPPQRKGARSVAAKEPRKKAPVLQNLSGHVMEIASSPTGTIFAASWDGIFRTTDIARGWEKLTIPGYAGRMFSVAVSAKSPDVVYAGISNGLAVSFDGGDTWTTTLVSKNDPTCVQEIAVHPVNPDMVIVGTRRSAYLSLDAGKTWERLGRGIAYGDITAVRFNPQSPDEILIGDSQDGGLYFSTDGGERFRRIDRAEALPSHRMWAVAFDPFDSGQLYAGSMTSGVLVGTLPKETLARR
jgi:photosystem II stability/assembly factor-like uncharacterized protein